MSDPHSPRDSISRLTLKPTGRLLRPCDNPAPAPKHRPPSVAQAPPLLSPRPARSWLEQAPTTTRAVLPWGPVLIPTLLLCPSQGPLHPLTLYPNPQGWLGAVPLRARLLNEIKAPQPSV